MTAEAWKDYLEALTKSYPENPERICTCPDSQWIGSEPNDSTCELSEEEHEAITAQEMCVCGHEREAHFDFGCGCETEPDVTCECKEFRRL